MRLFVFICFILTLALAGFIIQSNSADTDCMEYNGDGARSHYSALTQINKENVH